MAEGRGDAFVSAGSTGALHVGASLFGAHGEGGQAARAGHGDPRAEALLLLDCGANVECRPAMLEAFGVMGSVYMNKVMGVAEPKVALVNNGAEESKGTPTYVEAHRLLKANPESGSSATLSRGTFLRRGGCGGGGRLYRQCGAEADRGAGEVLFGQAEGHVQKSVGTKLGYLLVKGGVADFKRAWTPTSTAARSLLGRQSR